MVFNILLIERFIVTSRADDIESFVYLLIFLLNGQLPWREIENGVPVSFEQCFMRVLELKESPNLRAMLSDYFIPSNYFAI